MQESKELVVHLPKISESVHSARVVKWLKQEGQSVKLDEALVEVSTAKVNSEIPSPFEGVLKKIHVKETQELSVGDNLCTLVQQGQKEPLSISNEAPKKSGSTFLSPAVLKMASDHGICVVSLQNMKGSGANDRVTKCDVQTLIKEKSQPKNLEESSESEDRSGLIESLVKSHKNIPDASLILDLKMQPLVDWMKDKRSDFENKFHLRITYTTLILKALGQSMKEFKHLQYDGCCNIGIAMQKGQSLRVPVLENVDTLSLDQIASKLQELQSEPSENHARANLTFSNFGKSGVQIGLPIVPEGQNAILALGALEKRVVATEENAIQVESRAWVTLAFDHRVFDGMYGAQFLQILQKELKSHV